MRRISFASLFIAVVFSFFSCDMEEASSSVSFMVEAPVESSVHGYQISDLTSCKLEVFSTNGISQVHSVSLGRYLSVPNLQSGSISVRAYGYDSFGSAIALSDLSILSVDGDAQFSKIVQLKWSESGRAGDQYCYIKFDTDGGSPLSQQRIKAGNILAEPQLPTKENASFDGWFWNAARTCSFNFNEAVSCNLTLHAKWVDGQNNNPENPNDGQSESNIGDDNNNSNVNPEQNENEQGESGSSESGSGEQGEGGAGDNTGESGSESGETGEEGGSGSSESGSGEQGEGGAGDNTGESGSESGESGEETGSDTEEEVPEGKFRVTFYKNDGTDQKVTYFQNKGDTLWMQYFREFLDRDDGYYFLGWARSADAVAPEYAASDKIDNVTESRTFYAVWTTEFCTVRYINSYNTSETITKKIGKNAKIHVGVLLGEEEAISKPEGYNMKNYSPNLAGTEFVTETQITTDKTYYILWSIWLVCHESHAGTNGEEFMNWTHVIYPNAVARPSYVPYWDKHIFVDWYTDESLTTLVDFSSLSASDADSENQIHIYAKWNEQGQVAGFTVNLQSVIEDASLSLALSGTTFTASSGFASYLWKIDGTVVSSGTSNIYNVDTSSLSAGIHNVLLSVTDSNGIRYSAKAVITVDE